MPLSDTDHLPHALLKIMQLFKVLRADFFELLIILSLFEIFDFDCPFLEKFWYGTWRLPIWRPQIRFQERKDRFCSLFFRHSLQVQGREIVWWIINPFDSCQQLQRTDSLHQEWWLIGLTLWFWNLQNILDLADNLLGYLFLWRERLRLLLLRYL